MDSSNQYGYKTRAILEESLVFRHLVGNLNHEVIVTIKHGPPIKGIFNAYDLHQMWIEIEGNKHRHFINMHKIESIQCPSQSTILKKKRSMVKK